MEKFRVTKLRLVSLLGRTVHWHPVVAHNTNAKLAHVANETLDIVDLPND